MLCVFEVSHSVTFFFVFGLCGLVRGGAVEADTLHPYFSISPRNAHAHTRTQRHARDRYIYTFIEREIFFLIEKRER